jgi:RNA polymerase sigma factor (sigma-70 family)
MERPPVRRQYTSDRSCPVPEPIDMPTSLSDRLIAPLRRLALARDPHPRTDGQLLSAFVSSHDSVAFEAIVRRHGPMVLGVCRRVIGDPHAADDAFQAVFVVLVRRAAAVRPREQLANFLFGVAYRVALKARSQIARRRTRETQVAAMPEPAAPADLSAEHWADLQPVLDAELAALPDYLRLPVVLCDLQGRTQREVAKQLNLPTTTLVNRLAAARRRLAARLSARGVSLAGGALAAVVSANAATAAVAPHLVASATRVGLAAVGSGAGTIPANVLQLSEGVVRMFVVSKLKLTTTAVLAGLTLLAGAGVGMVKADDKPAAAKIRPDLNDREFLKRVCDSLRGSPATPAEMGYFVADTDAAKRRKVVTWLTEGPKEPATVLLLDAVYDVLSSTTAAFDRSRSLALTGTVNTAQDDLTARVELVDPVKKEGDVDVELKWKTLGDTVLFKQPNTFVVDFDQPQQEATQLGLTRNYVTNKQVETDDAFLTRVIEAARGGKPTRLEKEYFAADTDAKKREKLLDLILSDPATAKKLGPDWKKNTLNPPQTYSFVYYVTSDTPWAGKLIDELLAAKKTDDQTLEALTLAATGRLPTGTEKKLAAAMVAKQKDKKVAWAEVAATLGSTDEAKAHADRLKPTGNRQSLNTFRLHVQPTLELTQPKK